MTTIPFTNFTKGEISPELQARIDTSQYSSAAKKVRNFIIQRYGGLSFRPGFRLAGEVDDVTKDIRYIPFQFNIAQAYIMALEDSRMRLLAGGGFIAEDNVKITAITKAANGQVTATLHGLVVGDRIFLDGLGGMTQLNGRHATVASVVDANNFTISINTLAFGTFTSSTGITRTVPPAAPPALPPPPAAVAPQPAPPTVASGGGTGGSTGATTTTDAGTTTEFEYEYPIPRWKLIPD